MDECVTALHCLLEWLETWIVKGETKLICLFFLILFNFVFSSVFAIMFGGKKKKKKGQLSGKIQLGRMDTGANL